MNDNRTINYYNKNAEDYYRQTINVDFDDIRERFLAYIPEGGRIMDVGCGSGRDCAAFRHAGYRAEGLDASAELAEMASARHDIDVSVISMEDWISDEPFDGIWCCASLLHLAENECKRFLSNLKYNLKPGGIIFISVKTGIKTGYDEKERYMQNYTEESLRDLIIEQTSNGNPLGIKELWLSDDSMSRETKWLNMIVER